MLLLVAESTKKNRAIQSEFKKMAPIYFTAEILFFLSYSSAESDIAENKNQFLAGEVS